MMGPAAAAAACLAFGAHWLMMRPFICSVRSLERPAMGAGKSWLVAITRCAEYYSTRALPGLHVSQCDDGLLRFTPLGMSKSSGITYSWYMHMNVDTTLSVMQDYII